MHSQAQFAQIVRQYANRKEQDSKDMCRGDHEVGALISTGHAKGVCNAAA